MRSDRSESANLHLAALAPLSFAHWVLATQKEQRPGSGEPQSAAVWLDDRSEWQVQGIVRHDDGNIRLGADGLHILRAGRRGWLRRTRWSEELALPVEQLKSIQVSTRGRGQNVFDVAIQSSASAPGSEPLTLRNCRPVAALRALVEQLQAANPALTVSWPAVAPG